MKKGKRRKVSLPAVRTAGCTAEAAIAADCIAADCTAADCTAAEAATAAAVVVVPVVGLGEELVLMLPELAQSVLREAVVVTSRGPKPFLEIESFFIDIIKIRPICRTFQTPVREISVNNDRLMCNRLL
jgi:hypothetical protein